VFRIIDPKALDAAFARLLADITASVREGDVIAVDGKALRGARDRRESAGTRMMVSAYASRLRLTLASVPADRGAELDAALEVLGLIALKGKVGTADALHCNRRTVAAINAGGGDWCLALKANQESLLSDARACFGRPHAGHPVARSEDTGHGRKEVRTATVVSAKGLAEHHDFPGLKGFGRIEASREIGGTVTSETRFFALSWLPAPEVLLTTVRAHWGIENALHWQLDVSFREDAARNRKDNGPGNIAVLRRRALDVVRRDTSKGSLSIKLKRAGWDDAFLRSILKGLASA
jgi:predicted transposase YbfD/YdcC